jgi:hypothetical protein
MIPEDTAVLCKDSLSTRLNIAFIRASNSFGEKGFTT